MCFFPLPNTDFSGVAYKKGVREFECGACPECLNKRSSAWALRSVYEASERFFNCMITLTYDNYARDSSGNIIGELPPDRNLHVCKRDIQLFIKRLRKWYSGVSSEKIKYLCCAEYGSRTHRAHYHLILFGVRFPDLCFYKKSKRNNVIYHSDILERLWGHGICSVDSIRIHGAVARYCTKYCAKSRCGDAFMLFSQGIGSVGLLKAFNGRNYMIDGREYTIPRFIWQKVIMAKYSSIVPQMDYRYVNRVYDDTGENLLNPLSVELNKVARRMYRFVRDNDEVYQSYLSYWSSKSVQFEHTRLNAMQRILALPDAKYLDYKFQALRCLRLRKIYPVVAPGSHCISAYGHWAHKMRLSLAPPSCHNRASDTTPRGYYIARSSLSSDSGVFLREVRSLPPIFVQNAQICFL